MPGELSLQFHLENKHGSQRVRTTAVWPKILWTNLNQSDHFEVKIEKQA